MVPKKKKKTIVINENKCGEAHCIRFYSFDLKIFELMYRPLWRKINILYTPESDEDKNNIIIFMNSRYSLYMKRTVEQNIKGL